MVRRGVAVHAGLLALVWTFPCRAAAQDTHYWAEAYGTQARLLGGTVIGSDDDISAVYYNPGAVALAVSPELLISLNGLRYSKLDFSVPAVAEGPGGTGWSTVSNMIAGVVPIGGRDSKSRMAYSILTRQAFDFGAQLREIPLEGFLPAPPPPPTISLGNALLSQSLNETWVGATYASRRSERWGLGATMFVAVRSQTYSQTVSAQVVNGVGTTALAVREYDLSYSNWGLLVKLGAQYNADHWSAGLTMTTPRLRLTGGGDLGATSSYVDEGVAGPPGSQIATDYQPDLYATHHSPFSVGAGVGHRWKQTTLDLAAEWFAAVPRFATIAGQAFTPQTGGPAIPMTLSAEYRSVLNWGVGVRQHFGTRFDAYAAFRTDRSAVPPGVRSVGTLVNWDLRHVNLGVQLAFGRASVILGIDHARGGKDDVSAAGDPPPGLPALPAVDLSFASSTVAIGFKLAY